MSNLFNQSDLIICRTLQIRYTVDGKNVTNSSMEYGGPISLDDIKIYIIKAKTFKVIFK